MAKSQMIFETVFESYEAVGILGQGGSGRVYEVKDSEQRRFAVKCLTPELTTSLKLKRFKNELDFCRKHSHQNVVRVIDSGFTTVDGKKTPFYVMPLYPLTLRKLIEGKLTPDRVLPLFSMILDGIESAHLLTVYHRDLKPENILYDPQQNLLVVADFGVAHFEEELCLTLVDTKDAERLANFGYSAPEQRVKGNKADHRADIYALGLILNEMFTGSVPQGEGYAKIGAIAPDFAYLDEIVADMIQQSPEARSSSIAEVKNELIGHRNFFVAEQRLDQKRNEVVPISTPSLFEPIKIIDVDWEDDLLNLTFDRAPEHGWIRQFSNRGVNSSGFEGSCPENFRFELDHAWVHASSGTAKGILNFAKGYVERANKAFEAALIEQAATEERERRLEHEREVEAAQRRAQVLNALKL